MTKTIRIKRILSHEVQKEAKETCPPGMSYFLLSCHQCDRYDYCNLLWEFRTNKHLPEMRDLSYEYEQENI